MTGRRRSLVELGAAARDLRPTPEPEGSKGGEESRSNGHPTPAAAPPASSNTVSAAPAGDRPAARPAGPDRLNARRGSRWDELERKETRLRPDQYEALTVLSRRLNRDRRGRGQRITENTLIRVAIDLLLTHPGLTGVDEAELWDSASQHEPKSVSP